MTNSSLVHIDAWHKKEHRRHIVSYYPEIAIDLQQTWEYEFGWICILTYLPQEKPI